MLTKLKVDSLKTLVESRKKHQLKKGDLWHTDPEKRRYIYNIWNEKNGHYG